MKLITDNKIYVEMKDLIFIGNLPNFVIEEITQNKNGFEVFKNKDSIEYFKRRNEIINYNDIRFLEEEGIYDIIHAIYEKCFEIMIHYPKSTHNIIKLQNYEYMVRSLKEYIDYRKIMDKKYYSVSKGKLESSKNYNLKFKI